MFNNKKNVKIGEHNMKLETYKEKKEEQDVIQEDNILKKIWNKSIFPDMIKDKKEEKAFIKNLTKEAKREALLELKDEFKENIKKQELEKLNKKNNGSGFLDKLAKEFQSVGNNSSEKISQSLRINNNPAQNNFNNNSNNDKISTMLGINNSKQNKKNNDFEDKIRRML